MRGILPRVTSALLLLVFPCVMLGAGTGAMVYPSGTVALNGNALAHPTAVFNGDKVNTTAGSAWMAIAGGTVQVSPESSMMYAADSVTLGRGAMRVVTSAGTTGRVLNLTVRPAGSGTVKYEMNHANGKVLVAALEGKLRINDGRQAMILEPGKMVTLPVPHAEAVSSGVVCAAGKHQEIAGGEWSCMDNLPEGGGSPAPAGGAGGGLNLTGAQIGLITVASFAAASAAAYGIATALNPSPASPAH